MRRADVLRRRNGAAMRIILSPAKKMNADPDSLPCEGLPQFLSETKILLHALQEMDAAALKTLWNCNDTLTKQNLERLRGMDLTKNPTPALLCYQGLQYRRMAPGVFEDAQLQYVKEHLRILSGFYGILRPFDGVVPYRLEMQARLSVESCKDLYTFWGNKLARQLCSETDFILNLASKEYSRAITPYLPGNVRFLTCTFGELSAERSGRI
ncbi:MAG: YaaA family protein, partial [Ruthenibacterium sp.]